VTAREVDAGVLLGRMVRDADGHRIGRIEELYAEHHDAALEVKTFMIGETGLVARLDVPLVHNSILRAITWIHERLRGRRQSGYAVSWKQMDLSDPMHPRTNVARDRLKQRA
jgi:hypothetical protein